MGENKGSLLRSSMSHLSHSQVSHFKAHPFKEKGVFVVKKSTKVLTVPDTFNLNTDKRAQERSRSKN